VRIVEAREKLSLGAIERAAILSIIEQNQAVRTKPVPEFEVAAIVTVSRSAERRWAFQGLPPMVQPTQDRVPRIRRQKVAGCLDDGAAQQQAAVHHDAIALDTGNRGSLQAHNLGLGVGEAEFPLMVQFSIHSGRTFRCPFRLTAPVTNAPWIWMPLS